MLRADILQRGEHGLLGFQVLKDGFDHQVNEKESNAMAIQNIFVVGAGLMGSGIAQNAITSGYNVTLNDAPLWR